MTGPTPTPITPQPGPTLVSATGIPPRGTSAPPLAPPLSMQLLPRPSSYNSTSTSKPRWLMVWGGRTQEAKPMAKAKQLSKAKAKTKEWTQRWTLQPPLPGKGGHITGTSQGPGIPHAPGVVTGQANPMQLREHPSQQAKVADGVERKHARGKTNGKGKAIKQSQSQSQSQSQNNNKSKRQAPEDVKAVFIQTPENTSALVGTTAQFNCTADGAASVTYLVNNMILAALTSLGVQLSEHYDSSGSQTSAYLRVPVTRDMTNWPVVCIAYLPNGTRVDSPLAYLHVQAPPSAPQHLTANDTGATNVILSWLPPEDTGLGRDLSYKVYYQDVNGTSNTTTTYHNVTGLFPNTTYTMTVMADNGIAGDEEERSVSVNVTTKASDTHPTDTTHISPEIVVVVVVVVVVVMLVMVMVVVLVVVIVVMVVVAIKKIKLKILLLQSLRQQLVSSA